MSQKTFTFNIAPDGGMTRQSLGYLEFVERAGGTVKLDRDGTLEEFAVRVDKQAEEIAFVDQHGHATYRSFYLTDAQAHILPDEMRVSLQQALADPYCQAVFAQRAASFMTKLRLDAEKLRAEVLAASRAQQAQEERELLDAAVMAASLLEARERRGEHGTTVCLEVTPRS